MDSTAQRPPSATSSKEGAEQTGERRPFPFRSAAVAVAVVPVVFVVPAPGKSVAAEHTGLALAVAEALAEEEEPPEVVEAEATAVEATAALSAASASERGDGKVSWLASGLAPAGRNGALPVAAPPPPLRSGFSQSSRLVATSVELWV